MKILHIVHWPKSGISSLLYNILSEHGELNDIKSYIIFFKEDSDTTNKFRAVTKYTSSLSDGVYSLKTMISLRNQIKSISPDIIHVHSFLPHLYAVLLNADVPIIRTIHSDYPYFHEKKLLSLIKRKIEHYLIRRSNAIVSVSQSLTEELQSIFSNVGVETISNGICLPEKENTRQAVRQELSVPDNSLVYISVGRLEAQKGYDLLVSAFSRSLRKTGKIYLLILGEGSQYEQLNDIVKHYKTSKNIRLLGYQDMPYRYLNASDIYISSARYEGFGLSVAEAQSVGLPVIGFDVAGVRDVVIDGVTGIIERKVSEESLEKLVNNSFNNIDEVRIMGSAAENHIKEKFTINQTVKNYFNLYNKILNA